MHPPFSCLSPNIDFNIISKKLQRKKYKSLGGFVDDLATIYDNGLRYNASNPHGFYYICAVKLQEHVAEGIKK